MKLMAGRQAFKERPSLRVGAGRPLAHVSPRTLDQRRDLGVGDGVGWSLATQANRDSPRRHAPVG